jgi:hypothetical protein
MNDQIQREAGVQGTDWNSVHGGYFSDPVIAAPFLKKVIELANSSGVDTIVDLGGGTGTALSLLRDELHDQKIDLINIDDSDSQLDAARNSGLTCIKSSIDSFHRNDINADQVLFMMRSVLHYAGQQNLRHVLEHIGKQTRAGEFFVHQSASFTRQQDADVLNELYRLMHTPKWYPTADHLEECLIQEGWRVVEITPAPPLPLTHTQLMRRYGLSAHEMASIRDTLAAHDVPETVLKVTDDGFCAYLHYWIYTVTR